MRQANLGAAISIAVGFALQVSGLGGPVVSAIAWVVVALLVGLAVFLRLHGSGPSTTSDTLHGALRLGRDMLNFIQLRRSRAPSPSPPSRARFGFLPGRYPLADRAQTEAYDAETMSLWTGRFAKRLSATVAELHRFDQIGPEEARRLIAPSSPADVEGMARRLIELGCQSV